MVPRQRNFTAALQRLATPRKSFKRFTFAGHIRNSGSCFCFTHGGGDLAVRYQHTEYRFVYKPLDLINVIKDNV